MKSKQKPKKNKIAEQSLNIWQFLLIWIVTHIGALLAAWWIIDSMGRFNPLDATNAMLMGLGMGIPVAVVQYLVIRKLIHVDLRYWLPMSAIGWLMSGIVLHLTSTEFPIEISLQILIFFLIPATLQSVILRQHIQNAWLWMLANAVGGIVLAFPITTTRSIEAIVLTAGGILQTIVTGIIIFWLFRQFDTMDSKRKQGS